MTALLLSLLSAAPNPFLAEALELERSLDFEGCVTRLEQASTQWKSSPEELREIELHAGLCTFNLGKTKLASGHFRMALRIDENARLPTYTNPRAVKLFEDVRRAMPTTPSVDEDLKSDAPVKAQLVPVNVAAPAPSFLARRGVSLILGGVTVASVVTGIVLALQAQAVAKQANAAHFESDFFRLGADAQGLATGATISWVLAALCATSTIVAWVIAGDEEQP